MRRRALVALSALLCLIAFGACSPANEDIKELRAYLTSSGLEPRAFEYKALGETDEFEVRGSVQDDFRYKMVLSADGRELVQYVVQDDALAVRLADPEFGGRLANQLGDPLVDAALKEGKWVVDPSGAPALFKADDLKLAQARDPFSDAREALLAVERDLGESRFVKEFTLEDVEYRPQHDPWRYPDAEEEEKRYDLLRPFLPKTEGQASFGRSDSVTPAQFRKESVFVDDGRIEAVCSLVDVRGHEEFVRLRKEGLDSNEYLARVLRQIEERETAVPIEQRAVIVELEYPDEVSVGLPRGAVVGKLETFTSALQQAVTAGALRPDGDEQLTDCVRTEEAPA